MRLVLQPVALQVAEVQPDAKPQRRRFMPGAIFSAGPDCPAPIAPDPVEGSAEFYEGAPFAMAPEKDDDGHYDTYSLYAIDVCYDEEVDVDSNYHSLDTPAPNPDEASEFPGESAARPHRCICNTMLFESSCQPIRCHRQLHCSPRQRTGRTNEPHTRGVWIWTNDLGRSSPSCTAGRL